MKKNLLLTFAAVLLASGANAQSVGDFVRTSDGRYQITGTNLITNGDFSNGTTGWKTGAGNELPATVFATATGSPTGGYSLSVIATEGSANEASDSAILVSWQTVAGKDYVISYYVKSGAAANVTNSSLYVYQNFDGGIGKDAGSGYDETKLGHSATYGTDWKQVYYVFHGQGSFLTLNFFNLANQESFANFYLGEVKEVANTDSLNNVIARAKALLDDAVYVNGREDLQASIDEASTLTSSESIDDVNDAILALENAVTAFKAANTIDVTSKLVNADFYSNAKNATVFNGWTSTGFKGNISASYSAVETGRTVNRFVEQWTSSSATALHTLSGSGDIYQTLTKLPAGRYHVTADAMATQQGDDNIVVEGARFYVNDDSVAVSTRNGIFHTYEITKDIADGQDLKIGYAYSNFTGNWLAFDNVTVEFIGDTLAYRQAEAKILAADAQAAIQVLIDSIHGLQADTQYPLGQSILADSLAKFAPLATSVDLTELNAAQTGLNEAIKDFYGANDVYFTLRDEITKAEALYNDETYTAGRDEMQGAIDEAKSILAEQTDLSVLSAATTSLKDAETVFGIANASYAHPVAIIDDDCSSMTGWTCLNGGTANPALHINTSGNVGGFNKPFMECWASSSNGGTYGQANYAKKSAHNLPAGYYVLDADVNACNQGYSDPSAITGVTLNVNDTVKAVSSANGTSNHYSVGYVLSEGNDSIEIGLNIDAATTANWIAWDNVKLTFYGDREKYIEDYQNALFGTLRDSLKNEIAKAEALKESVTYPEGTSSQDLDDAISDANDVLEIAESELDYTEGIANLIQAEKEFRASGVSPKDGNSFDLTDMIVNPSLEGDIVEANKAPEGWTSENDTPSTGDEIGWYLGSTATKTQSVSQTVSDLPEGNYLLTVRAVYRQGFDWGNVIDDDSVTGTAYVQINDSVYKMHNSWFKDIAAEGVNESDFRHLTGTYLDLYRSGFYDLTLPYTLKDDNTMNLKIGVIDAKGGTELWISGVKLAYYGQQEISTGIKAIESAAKVASSGDVYTISGQKVRANATSLKGLAKGIYIINGKKIVVR